MSLASSPGPTTEVRREDVRDELVGWLTENWIPNLGLVEWRRRLVDARWAVPSWSREWYGRDLPAWADEVVAEELRRVGAPGLPLGAGMHLVAPTILAHGSRFVKERFLRPILTGEETWCQLFSEPGAGSDLAGLTTRATLDGDQWVVNGQKVWNTSAHHADFGILVARSNWDVPKHRGLTYLILPMRQPGVEVRPLAQMNFYSSFNEVFMSDATAPANYVVGEVGGGWTVALTTLSYERRFGGLVRPRYAAGVGRAVDEAQAEADAHFKTYEWYPQRQGRVDLVVEHAHRAGRSGDPVVRQEIARLLSMQRVSGWTAARARAGRALGIPPGAEGSIGKLSSSHVARQAAKTHSMIAGAGGMLSGADGPYDGIIAEVLISVPAQSIAGGTDEIQRNILGEKILGLPREPMVGQDLPFRDVPRN
jgi:alkylation response protein AidB-like acyl-CoA dehydrogenase